MLVAFVRRLLAASCMVMAGSLSLPGIPILRIQASTTSRLSSQQFRAARASAVLLDWRTGKLMAKEGETPQATPGSLLKPLLLAYALQHGIVKADTQVYCRRTLVVAGRSLPCSHPNNLPMLDAQEALANSCNTWFAMLARHMTAQDMESVLRSAKLPHASAPLWSGDARVLTALGLENVTATPEQIANAYRTLLVTEPRSSAVWGGLRDSVEYGMAHNAHLQQGQLLGKTGTASNSGEWWTHGWFAGGVPDRFILVVYVPRGDGGTAATLAGEVLSRLLTEGGR